MRKLEKPNVVNARVVLEAMLKRASCDRPYTMAQAMARDMEARGLVIMQTHVVDQPLRLSCTLCVEGSVVHPSTGLHVNPDGTNHTLAPRVDHG